MHRHLHGGQIKPRPGRRIQLEHAHKHGGHPLAVANAQALDGLQRQQRVKALHDRDRATHLDHGHAVAQRRSMVERRGGEVVAVGVVAKQRRQQFHQHGALTRRCFGQRPQHALGPPGGARGIQHVCALQRRGGGTRGLDRTLCGPIAVTQPRVALAKAKAACGLGQLLDQARLQYLHACRIDKQVSPTVGHDVGDFIGRQTRADQRVVHATAVQAKTQLQQLTAIAHHHGHMVARLQSQTGHQMGHLVGALIELGKRDLLAALAHLKRDFVRLYVGRLKGKQHQFDP